MAKSSKKRSRTWIWVIGLLAGAVAMAALRSAVLSGLCLWSAIILAIVAGIKSSPKPVAGQANDHDDYDDQHYADDDNRRRRAWQQDRRREDEYFQDGFDAEQREHEDRGEV